MTTTVLFLKGPADGLFGEVPTHINTMYGGAEEDYAGFPNYQRSGLFPSVMLHESASEDDALRSLAARSGHLQETGELDPEPETTITEAGDEFDPRSYLLGIRDFCTFMLENDG